MKRNFQALFNPNDKQMPTQRVVDADASSTMRCNNNNNDNNNMQHGCTDWCVGGGDLRGHRGAQILPTKKGFRAAAPR